MIRIVFTGPRTWENPLPPRKVIKRLVEVHGKENLLIIVGGAAGLDSVVEKEAKAQGVHVAVIDALWDAYHKGAGGRRNRVMLSLEPTRVIAMHWDLKDSRGTQNCVNAAQQLGIPVKLFTVPLRIAIPTAQAWADAKAAKRRRPGRRKR